MKKLVILTALFGLGACASATEMVNSDVSRASLQKDTATYFATSTRNVKVVSISQSVLGTAYQSRVAGKLYNCQYFRGAVSCNRAH